MTFTRDDWMKHRARIARCEQSGCREDEHYCQDDEGEWATFGDDAA